MKKIIAIVLCLLLVMAISVTTFAAGASFSATASEKTLYRGDTVTLSVTVSCGEAATSYGLMLDYDSNVFELVEGSCTVAGTLVSSFNDGFAFMYQNATAYTGAVGTVTLKVKDDATFGATTITGDASIKNGTDVVEASGFSVPLTIDCKHNYGDWAESGEGHAQTCDICNDVKTADHAWDNGRVTEEATHYKEGTKTTTCTVCGTTKTQVIAKTEAHEWSEWTANDDGKTHSRACECGESETVAHDWTNWGAEGENYNRECVDCDASETIVIDNPINTTNGTIANLEDTDIKLVEKILTDEEQSEVANGADVSVYLDVMDITESVSEEHKSAVEEKAGDAEIGMYLDINLFKQVGGNTSQVTKTNGGLKITIVIPEELINAESIMKRTYKVVRVHEDPNGTSIADVIEGVFNAADKTFTFETEKFSTYAVIYSDKRSVVRPALPNEEFITDISNTTTSTTPTQKPNASTGGENGTALALTIMFLAGGCAIVAKKSRKNGSER